MCAGCCLYFLIRNSTQNVYSDKFSNSNNYFNVTNVRKLKVYYDISYLIDF